MKADRSPALRARGHFVDVWYADAASWRTPQQQLVHPSSPRDRVDAWQFPDAATRREFYIRRAFRRWVLGLYTGRPAGAIEARRDLNGREFVDCGISRRRLYVSPARSGDCIAVALSTRRLGFDLELLQSRKYAEDIGTFLGWTATSTGDEFLHAWVSEEARVKWARTGLARAPRGDLSVRWGTISINDAFAVFAVAVAEVCVPRLRTFRVESTTHRPCRQRLAALMSTRNAR